MEVVISIVLRREETMAKDERKGTRPPRTNNQRKVKGKASGRRSRDHHKGSMKYIL